MEQQDTQIDQNSQQHTNLDTPDEIDFLPNDQNAKQETNSDLISHLMKLNLIMNHQILQILTLLLTWMIMN